MASLVEAAPQPAARPAKRAPAKIEKPAPKAESQPKIERLAIAPAEAVVVAEADVTLPQVQPDEPEQPQLSDADAEAVDQFQPAAEGAPNQPCNLTGMLSTAFAQSPQVQQGLAELPPEQRSVANAVDLWDGQWADDSLSGGKGLLRALLVKAVTSARPDCLTVANRGPTLFLIPDNHTTVVLAVGSGDWRWGDLITPDPAMPDLPQPDIGNYFAGLASR